MFLLLLALAQAVPVELPVQARVLDSIGQPMTTTQTVTFTLYSDATGTTVLWQQALENIAIADGYVSARLQGNDTLANTPLDSSLLVGDVWLGIEVGDAGEMALTKMGAVPVAAVALEGGGLPAQRADDAAASCKALADANPGLVDGTYWIDGGTGTPRQVECDMDGGGWTLCYANARVVDDVRVVTGWHSRSNTTGFGHGEYARNCRELSQSGAFSRARVVYVEDEVFVAEASGPPSLNGPVHRYTAVSGPRDIGIEIDNPSYVSGWGHCFDQTSEDNSWGEIGINDSCWLDTSSGLGVWYEGLLRVEYWLQ